MQIGFSYIWYLIKLTLYYVWFKLTLLLSTRYHHRGILWVFMIPIE